MDKIEETYLKIISQGNNKDPYNWKEVRPIFDAQMDQIMKKINNRFKTYGFRNIKYIPFTKGPHYCNGHRWGLYLDGKPDRSDEKWWICLRSLKNIQTKNLIFKNQSARPQICYKKTFRPEGHSGPVHPELIGCDWI